MIHVAPRRKSRPYDLSFSKSSPSCQLQISDSPLSRGTRTPVLGTPSSQVDALAIMRPPSLHCDSDREGAYHDVAQHFYNVMSELKVPQSLANSCFKMIACRYNEPQRQYHTLGHIQAMIRAINHHELYFADPQMVMLAIFFHDIVYNPKRSDNEDASIVLFSEWAQKLGISPAIQKDVVQLIDRTKQHKVTDGLHPDLALFLDLDLEVLSRSPQEYEAYSRQVREEYTHIPNPLFAYLRGRFLRELLRQPSIYATETFQLRHEAQARHNIKEEIEKLSKVSKGITSKVVILSWNCFQSLKSLKNKIIAMRV